MGAAKSSVYRVGRNCVRSARFIYSGHSLLTLLVPREKRHVSHTSRFEEVTNGAREREKYEYACRCHISPSQERVLATYPRNRGDYERLGSLEALYRIVVIDLNLVLSRRQGSRIVSPVQFRKRGQTCCSHPVLEVLILCEVWGWAIVRVVVRVSKCPVGGRHDLIELSNITGRCTVFLGFAGPSDAVLGKVIV